MREKIISLIPSGDLKRKIEETNHVFSDIELLRIVDLYAPSMEERIDMMRHISETSAEDVSALASEYIHYETKLFCDFLADAPGTVYELNIKETPDSYCERYLCASYAKALLYIDDFYKEYERIAEEGELTSYEITKRRVASLNDDFSEDTLFSLTLAPGKVVKRIYSYHDDVDCKSDSFCSECKEICHRRCDGVRYPNFAENFFLLKYRDHKGREAFAINLQHNEFDYDFIEEFYILKLDSPCIKKRGFSYETIFEAHGHLMLPDATLATEEELSPDMREDYRALVTFLKSLPEYMSREDRIDLAAKNIMELYRPAFEELAK